MTIWKTPLVVLFAVQGCAPGTDESTDPEDPRQPSNPPPPPAIAAGYELTSQFDVTAAALVPGPAHDVLELVRGVRQAPAETMFHLLDEAGVPIVGTLRDVLPGALEDRLEEWVGDALESAGIADELDWIVEVSEVAVTRFEMMSELDLDPTDASGLALGTHRAGALRFHLPGMDDVTVTLPGLVVAPVSVQRSSVATNYSLAIGSHSFTVGFGQYAYTALETAVFERTGTSLRGWLGAVADCPAVAAAVASRCVFHVCVGHATELQELCEAGLDEIVEEIHDQFIAIDYEAIRFDAGVASLAATGLSGGVWEARIDLGQGLRSVPATFTGVAR